jgi:hypothetical protein
MSGWVKEGREGDASGVAVELASGRGLLPAVCL